jgi:hypothetical protein
MPTMHVVFVVAAAALLLGDERRAQRTRLIRIESCRDNSMKIESCKDMKHVLVWIRLI